MNNSKQDMVNAIKAEALRLGFADCAISPATIASEHYQYLQTWLKAGHHGDMTWMEERAEQRADPKILWPDAKSVIMLSYSYAPSYDPMLLAEMKDKARISVYAQGRDYHDIVKKLLKALARWMVEKYPDYPLKVFVDTAPVMEKRLAHQSGLGWQGKHSNVISRSHGNWIFLGAIYTALDLPPDKEARDNCGACTACQTACPTNAFIAPYRLDAASCISYLTIENKAPIARKFRAAIGNHIYGCDDCLAACPWNKFADSAHRQKAMLPKIEMFAPNIADLLQLDDAAFREFFSGSPVKRTGRDRFIRNVLIAAGNSGNAQYIGPIIILLDDPHAVVRGAAIWALSMLDKDQFHAQRSLRLPQEQDANVIAEWNEICPVEAIIT
ncbi:tRNA epoxyqueuosine(34) reductase QueG [Sphingorhabdus lutea]|uniref:Epoxyqueuosine reductase n=1 Tax=Sphingorhabdus lutea TaxID=1913578 RepID=A0A1L3J998_9SPHN|nr:tRNA epoxyqueuosine(34) reductase QueG [Sphingorhabdus lutea]APG61697.1 tRNA epoxyqueuosine(34) reductase QueG [Sphingorhabdus lutea]